MKPEYIANDGTKFYWDWECEEYNKLLDLNLSPANLPLLFDEDGLLKYSDSLVEWLDTYCHEDPRYMYITNDTLYNFMNLSDIKQFNHEGAVEEPGLYEWYYEESVAYGNWRLFSPIVKNLENYIH